MAGKFVVTKGKDGQDYFVLKASNGQVILQSEGYKTRKSCANGIESVRKNAGVESRFECRTAKNGKAYFVLKASNGQEIGRSQMYKSDSGCRNGMKSVAANAAGATVELPD
ncbi:YegP family protein [Elongatibacter sediminis]|uniref:YegP family protein n=1 Tax=Elongatibacter sediminis TaxID=3119006 RepID=A0AAW9RMK2_9GAMM